VVSDSLAITSPLRQFTTGPITPKLTVRRYLSSIACFFTRRAMNPLLRFGGRPVSSQAS